MSARLPPHPVLTLTTVPSMLFAFIATFCAAVFFGAAAYISIVQHPAAMRAGDGVAGRLLPPMYRRAAPMQASLAIIGSLAAVGAWLTADGWGWLVGGLFLFAAVPFTLLGMKRVNDQLMQSGRDPRSAETLELLRRWVRLHWVRSILAGVVLLLFLAELAFA